MYLFSALPRFDTYFFLLSLGELSVHAIVGYCEKIVSPIKAMWFYKCAPTNKKRNVFFLRCAVHYYIINKC